MSGQLGVFFNLVINCPEEIDAVLRQNPTVNQKVSEVQNNLPFSVDQVSPHLDLSDLFETTYSKSLGFAACRDIPEGVKAYRELLERFEVISADTMQLYVRALQCHQRALQYWASEDQSSAIAAMAETGEIANEIDKVYGSLGTEVQLFRDREVRIMLGLAKDLYGFYNTTVSGTDKTVKELETELNATGRKAEGLIVHALKGVSELDGAIGSQAKITSSLEHVRTFWGFAKQQVYFHLRNPSLGDPDEVLMMGSEKSEAEEMFLGVIREAITFIETSAKKQEKKELSDVVKSMRTGRGMPTPNAGVDVFIGSIETKGVKEEFETSYLKWLAVAKTHRAMCKELKAVRLTIRMKEREIERMERDPVVIGLHAVAKASDR